MDILKKDIEKYEDTKNPTNINQQITDWTIYENDLIKIRELKRNTTKLKKRKKLSQPEPETELSNNSQILKPSKISKLNNIDNIIK